MIPAPQHYAPVTRYRRQIDAANEAAWLEQMKDKLHGMIEELAAGYGPNKANIPDLVGCAISHGEQMAWGLANRMKHLDSGDE